MKIKIYTTFRDNLFGGYEISILPSLIIAWKKNFYKLIHFKWLNFNIKINL